MSDSIPAAGPVVVGGTSAVAIPVLVRGWTEGRARRARMFAVLLGLMAVMAIWSSFEPWYAWSTAGQASCSPAAVTPKTTVKTPGSNTPVANAYASGCVTGRGLAVEYSTQAPATTAAVDQAMVVLDHENYNKEPAVAFGLPRTVTLLVIFSAVGMLGLAMRNAIIGLVAIVGMYYAHRDLGILQTTMTSGDGGALNVPQAGLQLFGWTLVLAWGLLVAATLFVAKHNADERAVAKQAAIAAGEAPPPDMIDKVLAGFGRKASVVLDAARREQERSQQATPGD